MENNHKEKLFDSDVEKEKSRLFKDIKEDTSK